MKKTLLTCCAAMLLAGGLNAFELKTRIYPAGIQTELRFKAVSKWAKEHLNKVSVNYMRVDRRHLDGKKYQLFFYPDKVPFKVEGDEIVVNVKLTGDFRKHTFSFIAPKKAGQKYPERRKVLLFTVNKEAFKLRPFKGNVHQHSKHSDGKYSAEEHVAYARIAGFDYTSVTDHGRIVQNPLAMKFAADSNSGLQVYFGEEVHSPGAVLHGLAIGGNKQFSRTVRTPGLAKAVKPILDGLIAKYPGEDVEELRCIAEGIYLARTVRKSGALVVFCHPGWVPADRLNNTILYTEHMLRSNEFDAVEIVNGAVYNCSNYIVAAQIYEAAAATGKMLPVMSSSDSHNVAAYGFRRNYNVIFAKDCTFPSFKSAFKEFRSVAVYEMDAVAGNKKVLAPLFYGPSRIMAYAEFLHKIGFWKKHDELTARQGRLLLNYFRGDKSLVKKIRALAEEIEAYRESIFYHPAESK